MADVQNEDPNSEANVNKLKGFDSESSDAWATLVTHITGYPVPDRKTIFEKLTSTSGGPLFRMDIRERDLKSVVSESGFLVNEGQDYDIFFLNKNKKSSLMQARIVFEGRVKSDNDIHFAGTDADDVDDVGVREGNDFKDYNKQEMSTIPLARYMNGPRAALMALRDGGTDGVKFADLPVDDANAVEPQFLRGDRGVLRPGRAVLQGQGGHPQGLGGPLLPGGRELERGGGGRLP